MEDIDIVKGIVDNGNCKHLSCQGYYGKNEGHNCPLYDEKYCKGYEDDAMIVAAKFIADTTARMMYVDSETDPNGIKPGEPGAKLDAGKVKAGILADFRLALMEVARVGSAGAGKYSRGGWQSVENGVERYTDAAWRHLLSPDEIDSGTGGTGCLHEAQVIWNLLAALELKLRDQQ